MIKFLPIGGADDIGANSYYLNIDGTGVLLDCGMHPRFIGAEALPKFDVLAGLPLDYVIITHAHHDHIGSLPFLIKKFPHVKIISTKQTQEIAAQTLQNSYQILKEQLSGDLSFELYDKNEIEFLIKSIITLEYENEISIRGITHIGKDEIRITLYDAGHILGSASILICYSGKRLFYTGDINLGKQSILNGAVLPAKPVDYLLMESTYGSTDSAKIGNWENNSKQLVSDLNKIIVSGGSVLIPMFSLGKLQEMLHLLYKLKLKSKLTETDIYYGGIGKSLCRIYDDNKYLVKRNNKNFELKDGGFKDYYLIKDPNEYVKNPSIILASSGMMLKGTYSYRMAKFWLKQKRFGLFTVGYMDPSTPGHKIQQINRGALLEFDGEKFKVECKIKRFYFNTHSKREELLEIVERLKPGTVILLHGENEAKSYIGYEILSRFNGVSLHSAEILKEIKLS